MSIAKNISTFAQSTAQANRLNNLRSLMGDLQRQVSTQKNFETFSGFGTNSFNLQNLHTKAPIVDTYISNVDKTATTLKQMTDLMTQMSSIGSKILNAINTRSGDKSGLDNLASQAQEALNFMEDILNQKGLDGAYLFSGSDVNNPPFIDNNTLNSNFNNEVTKWLNGTNSNQQIMDNTDAFTESNLGMAPGLVTTGERTVRVGDNIDIKYGLAANNAGMKNIVRALTFLANLKFPGAADVATKSDLDGILSHIANVVGSADDQINVENQKLSSKFSLLNSLRENHQRDLNLFQAQIDKLENADPATALIQMQSIQIQLTASFQVTKIMGELSLTNFI